MLTFKWNAILKNGQTISQFEIDGKENSFALVQIQDRAKTIKRFELICVEDGLVPLAVHLETGYFKTPDRFFHPCEVLTMASSPLHYRVVFYRRMRAIEIPIIFGRKPEGAGELDVAGQKWQLNLDGNAWGWIRSKTLLNAEIYRYLLGWQCTHNGLNYQRIMFYNPTSGNIEYKSKR